MFREMASYILGKDKSTARLSHRALLVLIRCASIQTVCGPFSGVPLQNNALFEFMGQLSQRLSYRHIARGALHEGQEQSSDRSPGPKHTQTPAPPYDTPGTSDNLNASTGSTLAIESNTRDVDDFGRRPSFVLVRCEASGTGPSARLLLKSCPFTPASWSAWCGGSHKGTSPPVSKGSTEPLPSSQHAARVEADIGRPRGAPQWAATAGDEGQGNGRPGDSETARATMEATLAALAAPGPTEVLAEAFERVLDVEEDDGDETSSSSFGGAGDATRRVFDCIAWVYDHVRYYLGYKSKLFLLAFEITRSRYIAGVPCGPYIGVNYEMVRNSRAQSSARIFLAYVHSCSPFLAAPQRTVEVGVSVRIYSLQSDTYNSSNIVVPFSI